MEKEFEKRQKSMKGTDGKDMNVLNKTPEEIKRANKICADPDGECHTCPYEKAATELCVSRKASDTLAYIEQLETDTCDWEIEATLLKSKCEQLERERDAAVEVLKGYGCTYCKRLEDPDESMCGEKCADFCNWEWRGVKEE